MTELTWTPRTDMGDRILAEEVIDRGWYRSPDRVGRPDSGLTAYTETDPRADANGCQHGQIRDVSGGPGPTARCLDCGCLIETAARVLLDDPQPLTDEVLDALRQEWNQIQFGDPFA